MMVIQILTMLFIWLGGFAAIGFAFAIWFASHVSGFFVAIAMFFGAFGAAGEVGYLLIERIWGRPRLPRWLLVGIWTLIAPTMAFAAMEFARQQTGIMEAVTLVLMGSFLPVFVVAYIASWPFRSRSNDFSIAP